MSLADRASRAIEELLRARTYFSLGRHAGPRSIDTVAAEWQRSVDLLKQQFASEMATTAHYLRSAEPFYWERPILDVIEAASATIPDWTLREELMPVPNGFFWFSRTLSIPYMPTNTDKVIDGRLRGICWGPLHPKGRHGVYIHYFIDLPEGYLSSSPLTWIPAYHSLSPFGSRHGDRTEDIEWAPLEEGDGDRMEVAYRIFGACLLFLEQRIAISSIESPDRGARRRFAKADIAYPPLRVIRLRTLKHAIRSDETEAVDWQFRWMVRGHWRQQFYPSDHSNRPIWIAPHIKGPDDKPLKTPERSVFAVVR